MNSDPACIPPQLARAYRETRYRVPALELTLRVGAPSPQLDAVLREDGVTEWAFLSAWHPRSVPTDAKTNWRQHQRLKRAVEAMGLYWLEGIGEGMGGDWPPEPSLMVPGLSAKAARKLCRMFDQNAFVAGKVGEPVRLVWCV